MHLIGEIVGEVLEEVVCSPGYGRRCTVVEGLDLVHLLLPFIMFLSPFLIHFPLKKVPQEHHIVNVVPGLHTLTFRCLFNDGLLEHIMNQTNLYPRVHSFNVITTN